MAKHKCKQAEKGSQHWLQELVNHKPQVLDRELRPRLKLAEADEIEWLSPKKDDDYAEYSDKTFLDRLDVRPARCSLDSFWPRGGPVWDGLGRTKGGDLILIEAKAHASEPDSDSKAKSPRSQELIRNSLAVAADYYGSDSPGTWTEGQYQYANRLAHLYFLRELNRLPAWLVFIYFVNDTTMGGPKSQQEWEPIIDGIHTHLGLSRARLSPGVIDLFVDVAEL